MPFIYSITFYITNLFFKIKNLTPNQAAAQALQLFSQEARLCDRHPNKIARTHSTSAVSSASDTLGNGSKETGRFDAPELIEPPATTCFNLSTRDPCDLDNNAVILNKTESLVSKTSGIIYSFPLNVL